MLFDIIIHFVLQTFDSTQPFTKAISPIPAPPPPPCESSTSIKPYQRIETKVNVPENDNQSQTELQSRSTIEYPVKQSVAALRNKIESKLNGSMPVRGYLTATGQVVKPEPSKTPLSIPKGLFRGDILLGDQSESIDISTPTKPLAEQSEISKNLSAIGNAIDSLQNTVYGARSILQQDPTKSGVEEYKPAESKTFQSNKERLRAERAKFFDIETGFNKESSYQIGSQAPPEVPPLPTNYKNCHIGKLMTLCI